MVHARSSSTLAAKLQQLFLQGKHADVVICVRVEGSQQVPTEIKAHSLMLRASSAYFDKCLSGEWAEATTRRVELTVEDEQGVEDVKLLIKLSYSDSYTHDDGELLPLGTRLRLAGRADALEFVEAVDQILKSLPQALGLEETLALINDLPLVLQEHPSMVPLLKLAADELPKHLGPIQKLYDEAKYLTIYNTLPLHEGVKQLPPSAFKGLLASELLQLQSENEAFMLLLVWLLESPHVDSNDRRLALFAELAPLLRYHHMTSDFLANRVSQCPLMQKSGLLPSVMHAAFVQRNAPSAILEREKVGRGLGKRGVAPIDACWELEASFPLEEVAALASGKAVAKWCGLVAGYPAALQVQRVKGERGETLGTYLHIDIPASPNTVQGAPAGGVALRVDWLLSPDVKKSFPNTFFMGFGRGYTDIFTKSWSEAVREGSPHFPNGKLEVKATVKLAT